MAIVKAVIILIIIRLGKAKPRKSALPAFYIFAKIRGLPVVLSNMPVVLLYRNIGTVQFFEYRSTMMI